MNMQHATQVTFQSIRGGRFSAMLPPKAASELADALMAVTEDLAPRIDKAVLRARLTSGQPMSQGDILSLLRIRPLFGNVGVEALKALEQFERHLRGRAVATGNDVGSIRNPFHSIRLSPPQPTPKR